MTTVKIYKDKRGGYRFTVKARNGEKIAASESYVSKWNAARGAKRAFPNAKLAK